MSISQQTSETNASEDPKNSREDAAIPANPAITNRLSVRVFFSLYRNTPAKTDGITK